MTTVTTDKELSSEIQKDCTKFVLIFSSTCGVCDYAEQVITQSAYTISVMVDISIRCESKNCPDFCEKHNVESVPGLFLFDKNGEEISSMLFAPDQDQFLFWITNNMVDD